MIFSKRKKKLSIVIILIIIFVVLGGTFYFLKKSPIQVISAKELKEKEAANLKILAEDPLWYEKTTLLLLDARSREEYEKGHLKNSMPLPPAEMKKFLQPDGKSIVIYSARDKFSEAKIVGEYLYKKNKELNREKKVGKIYLIKDGFEALKAAGFVIEEGFFD